MALRSWRLYWELHIGRAGVNCPYEAFRGKTYAEINLHKLGCRRRGRLNKILQYLIKGTPEFSTLLAVCQLCKELSFHVASVPTSKWWSWRDYPWGPLLLKGLQVLTVYVPWSTEGQRFAGFLMQGLPTLFPGLGPVQGENPAFWRDHRSHPEGPSQSSHYSGETGLQKCESK